MNDPQRLEQRDDALIRRMLVGARQEKPSAEGLKRTLAATGVGGASISALVATAKAAGAVAASSASATAPTAATVASAWSAAAFAKWTLVGLAGGFAVMGAVDQTMGPAGTAEPATQLPSAVASAAPGPSSAPPTAAFAQARSTEEDAPATARAGRILRPASGASALKTPAMGATPAPHHTDLLTEAKLLDRAREALRAGHGAQALDALNEYRRQVGAGGLGLEARYLRMEALLQQGNRGAAQNLARELLRTNPNGPHATRARAVLEGSNP